VNIPKTDFGFRKMFSCYKKVKQTLHSPEQPISIPAGSDSQISRQSAQEGTMVITPRTGRF
jgi:hypothetical protein